ncbi:lipoyl synthase [Candidatus Bipolaricaulota bacterium]|nr:lipoyl synthase [Candidatus Bipolaricaulota bacterium]
MNAGPEWIKATAPGLESKEKVGNKLREFDLNTVCREANCPNQGECWGQGTATFMLMGSVCTRNCRFCNVEAGDPEGGPDETEPERLRRAVEEFDLDYVVLTSVDRDDLAGGGAKHFKRVVEEIKKIPDPPLVEGLIPDFTGDLQSLERVARSGLEVVGHNIETVKRLSPGVRDRRAGYELSLSVLERVNQIDSHLVTKSSIMVGLGESEEEVRGAMEDLRGVGVDIVTVGQYLRPTEEQLPVEEFWNTSDFEALKRAGEEMGFSSVVTGPFVRSSYKARETYLEARSRRTRC